MTIENDFSFHLKKTENDWQIPASKLLGKGKKKIQHFKLDFIFKNLTTSMYCQRGEGKSLFLYKDLKINTESFHHRQK